jgi:hypothetical protein
MARKSCRLVVLALLAAAFSGAAHAQAGAGKAVQEVVDLSQESQALAEKIDVLLRHVPPFFDPANETQRTLAIAKTAGIEAIEVKAVAGSERLKLEDGSPAPLELRRLEISGRASYGDVLTFLHRMGDLVRLTDLETLRLKVEEGNVVRFTAGFAFPCYLDASAEIKPLPPDVATAFRDMLRQLKATHRLLTEVTERSKPRLVSALAAFDNLNRERATALTELQAGGEIVLKGLVAGASARDGLKPALEKAGFVVSHVETSPAGSCQAFSATARLEAGEVPWDYVPANGLFDADAAEVCSPEPTGGRVAAHGTATSPDALTLHLHGVRLSDVFFVLNGLTSQSFVIASDAGIKGRVSLDVEGATLDETLAAMSSIGVYVGPGPLHLVSRKPPAATAPRPGRYTGEAIDLSIRGADLKMMLCTLSVALEKPIWVPDKLDDVVTAFSTDLPADQVLDGLAAAAGLVSVRKPDRWIVGPAPEARLGSQKSVNACPPPAEDPTALLSTGNPSHLRTLTVTLPQLATGDLDLAGLANLKGKWKAYAYTPTQRLLTLEVGQSLLEANVGSIGPTGVTYVTGASAVEVPLRP